MVRTLSIPVAATLAVMLSSTARAQDPAPVSPVPPVPPAEEAAAEPEVPPRPVVPQPRITGIEVHGGIDPPGRVEQYVAGIVPVGSPFVGASVPEEEEEDEPPAGTVERLQRALERIGYHAVVNVEPREAGAKEVRLAIHLRAADRVRQIFVSGNWPLRQDEIVNKITLRPGQALPVIGPQRDARLEVERARIQDFLRAQGYLDAQVNIELHGTGAVPSPMNLLVRIDRGPGYPIGPITVRGNHAIGSNEIASGVRHYEWFTLWTRPMPYRPTLLKEDLRAFEDRYRDLGYPAAQLDSAATVDPRNRNVRLAIDVKERKKVEVVFEGNRSRSDDRLRDELTIFEKGRQGVYSNHALKESAEAVEQHYRERGHMFVRVTWRRERLGPDVDRVVFMVNEGPDLRVRGVEFVGNRTISAGTLSEVVNVKVFPWLGYIGLGAGGYASLRQLELDADNLAFYYREKGFPNAKVRAEIAPAAGQWRPITEVGQEAEWEKARSLHVRFVIEEGAREIIRSIRFQPMDSAGPLPRDDAFLRGLLLSRAGEPREPALMRQDSERLRRYFGDLGFVHARAEPQMDVTGSDATIVWQIRLGPHVRVGPIFVRGNFLTREETIMLWVPLRTGATLTTTDFERAQRNLALIQLFNGASPISFPDDDPGDAVAPMLIEVEERHDHWGVVRVGGGASTEQRLPGDDLPFGGYASVGYEHRNLLGRGWSFRGEGRYGNSVARADANFIDPRFFGTLFRLELTGSYRREATVRLGDLLTGAGSIGLAREMYPGIEGTVRYNLRDTIHPEFLLRSAGPDEDQRRVQIETIVGSLSLGIDWQRLDNPLVPTRGFKVSGGVEVALPSLSLYGGTRTFVKLTARSLSVVPLTPWLSLRHSLRYDHGFPFDTPVLPKVERFFAGGDTTIRGIELDRARSEIIRSELAPGLSSIQFRPVGGNLRILHNVEFQFPILRPWFGAVFIDTGLVADSLRGLNVAKFRHGVGISPLLVKLPVGDFSLSWAWPLDPEPGDARIGRLHFNVGLMF